MTSNAEATDFLLAMYIAVGGFESAILCGVQNPEVSLLHFRVAPLGRSEMVTKLVMRAAHVSCRRTDSVRTRAV